MFLALYDTSAMPSTITIPYDFRRHHYTERLTLEKTIHVVDAAYFGGYYVNAYEPVTNPSTGHVLRIYSSSRHRGDIKYNRYDYPIFECPPPAEGETRLMFVPEYCSYEAAPATHRYTGGFSFRRAF